ncbi:MAG: flavodoxin-dependent (E)-4-hydroxy-3-methylbut-2-enyl-diphosphate synthase [Vampirovibrionia bacterium]
MFERRKTTNFYIANVGIGSDHTVSFQSMTNTDTRDTKATIDQIKRLEDVDCELVRLAVVDKQAADAIKQIKKSVNVPLIADIHFDYRLAIDSILAGVDALRLNPGNIGSVDNVKKVVELAKERAIPIRIGVNAGSLEKEFADMPIVDAMVESALKHISILEHLEFELIKVSLKSSSVPVTIKAYEALAKRVNYPLHVGVTEAGTLRMGIIKSATGIGSLLAQGIGDTIRVSLTDDPVEEVKAAYDILKSLELRQKGLNLISCPTCGRTEINSIQLAKDVEKALEGIKKPLTVAVMGCVVNGPGEARHADIGIAGGKNKAVLFKKGEIIKTVAQDAILEVLLTEIKSML